MTRARAVAILGTVQFVKAHYGPEGHAKVLAALPEPVRPPFGRRLRESAWVPLRDLATYSETAHRLLAPEDADFYRRLGRFVGRFYRQQAGFAPMVSDPQTAMRLAPTMWRMLYDEGTMEIALQEGPADPSGPLAGARRGAVARIRGLRTSRALCQTNCGAIEGIVGSDEMPVRVEETACLLDGSPCCEMRLVWE